MFGEASLNDFDVVVVVVAVAVVVVVVAVVVVVVGGGGGGGGRLQPRKRRDDWGDQYTAAAEDWGGMSDGFAPMGHRWP